MTERFEFTDGIKKTLYILMVVGLVGLLGSFILYPENQHSRFWTNLLINSYFFTGIGIFGIFFVAANTLGYSGWISVVKRVVMSLSGFVVVGAVLTLVIVGASYAHLHNLYDHWMIEDHRKLLDVTKQTFYNPTFWAARMVLYVVLWVVLGNRVVKVFSAKNMNDKAVYKWSKLWAALWILVFAVTESFASWDYVMCIDPHWYSTLFGWYNFASYGCAAFAFSILLVLFLKSRGYLAQVNENHIHDLGKFMFGFSIFWTYLWFSQFMLQWYGNMPEDTNYWVKRFNVPTLKFTIFLALALNFLFPLLVILKRGNKRNYKIIGFASVVIIFGHYLDFFNMVALEPNAVETHHAAKHEASIQKADYTLLAENKGAKEAVAAAEAVATTEAVAATDAAKEEVHATEAHVEHAAEAHGEHATEAHGEHTEGHGEHAAVTSYVGLGIFELMVLAGFVGAFLFMFFNTLSKEPLINESDPYLKESLRHHVEYA